MKKYRVRPGSIADYAVRAWNKMDEEPYATVIFTLIAFAGMALLVLAASSEYPIY